MSSIIARFLPSLVPGLSALANPWVLLVIAGIAAGIWFKGYQTGRGALDDYIGKQAAEATRIVQARAVVTERVLTRYIERKGATRTVTETVEKEIVRYADANPGACLDARWGRLHDAAAANRVPDPAGGADDPGGAPTATRALEAVTESYAACHRTADRLDALQQWMRDQAAVR